MPLQFGIEDWSGARAASGGLRSQQAGVLCGGGAVFGGVVVRAGFVDQEAAACVFAVMNRTGDDGVFCYSTL